MTDFRKHSQLLGHTWTQGVPIEIVPLAHTKVLNDLLNLGAKNPQLRMGGKAKAGPILTDNGNFLIDAHFGEIADPVTLAAEIKKLVGVVEVGLFINMANAAYFGNEGISEVWVLLILDGSVTVQERNKPERKLEYQVDD
jgi:ribose 5-phosphate isomerase A